MGKKKGGQGAKIQQLSSDEEDVDDVTEGVAGVTVKPAGSPAQAFSFTPAPKGQTPASAGGFSFGSAGVTGAGAPAFSFSTGNNDLWRAASNNAAPFSFNFAAVPGSGGNDDDDDGDDIDHVAEFIASLPEPVQACVEELQKYDDEVSELEKEFRKELRELERKYEALYDPVFVKRADVVKGTKSDFGEKKSDGNGVPDFWITAMNHCMVIASNITEKDEVILKSLINITSATLPESEGVGFRLEFTFAPNEFFENEKLTKTYLMADVGDDPVLEKAEGTEINWHPGKNVTVKIKKKKQRNKNGKGTRVVTKTEPCESFFNFFSPPKIPGQEGEEAVEEEEMEHRQMELEADYEMGIAFQERVVPHAIKWFTGEAEDDDDMDDDDDDYEVDEDGDFDEELDDDEDEGDRHGGRGRGGGGGRARR